MNDAQHAAYQAYARHVARLVGLPEWDIRLERSHAAQNAYAQIEVSDRRTRAFVYLNEEFFGYAPEDQREHIVHELMHVHLGRYTRVLERATEMRKDEPDMRYVADAMKEEEEIAVHRLAVAWCPFLPLPPEVTA